MESKNKVIQLPLSYLDQVIEYAGRSLCGKILKRFEIIENKDILKSEVKEIVYEENRKIKEILLAFDYGREMTEFKFVTGPKES